MIAPVQRWAVTCGVATALSMALLTGCPDKKDTITAAEKTEARGPGIVETKAIAEEA
jgi:hypothetical protein